MVDHSERLRLILKETSDFYRVLITSRTQFFGRDEEIPRETGLMKVAARKAGESAEYVFYKIYLTPFTDQQILAYLKRRYPLWQRNRRKRAFEMAKKIPHLTARPMLLSHIDDLVKTQRQISYTFELYDEMVEAWITREQGFIEKPEELRRFSELLAVNLYVDRQKRGSELVKKDVLLALAKEWDIKLLDERLSGRSLLNRDADGNFKFAHRSIMEYLFVKRFASGDERCRNIEWTDNMKKFLVEMVKQKLSRWRSPDFSLDGADLTNLPRSGFTPRQRLQLHSVDNQIGDSDWELMRVHSSFSLEHLFSFSEINDRSIVFDWVYALMWQQSGSEVMIDADQAIQYLSDLNAQLYGGYDDWDLPTLEEAVLGSDTLWSRVIDHNQSEFFDRLQTCIWTRSIDRKGRQVIAPLPTLDLNQGSWAQRIEHFSKSQSSLAFVRAVRSDHRKSEVGLSFDRKHGYRPTIPASDRE